MIKTRDIFIVMTGISILMIEMKGYGGSKSDFPDKLDHSWSESESSLGSEQNAEKYSQKKKTTSGVSVISTQIAPLKELKLLEEKLNRIEHKVDQLSGEVKRNLDQVVSSFNANGLIMIDMILRKSSVANLQSVSISIDGHRIYETSDFNGIWLPSDQLTVYLGPLDPGKHRIDLSGRVIMLNPQEIPDSQSIHRMINRSFTIDIPDKNFKRKWTISIMPPASSDENVKADFIEGEFNHS